MMDLPTPPRPDDPREAAIWDDVFGAGETDLQYFQRRQLESTLADGKVASALLNPVPGFDAIGYEIRERDYPEINPEWGDVTFGDLEALWFCAAVSGGAPQGLRLTR